MRTSANRSAWLCAAVAALFSSAIAARAAEEASLLDQPGAAQWLDDVADLIEAHGYKFWTFHSYGEFYGWNLESIRDAETGKLRNIKDGETTDRLEAMKRHWAKNWE